MSHNSFSQSGPTRFRKQLDLQLLELTKGYLRKKQRGLRPSDQEGEAFKQFYDLCDGLLRYRVAAHGLKGEDRKDCLQEAWTAITKGLLAFECNGRPEALWTWMRKIVRNKAADINRDRVRHATKPIDEVAAAQIQCPHASPAAQYEKHWAQDAVRQLLKRLRVRLPKSTYRAFRNHWIDGKTVKIIASEMHLSPHGVSCRLSRALKELRLIAQRDFPKVYGHLHIWGGTESLIL